MPMQTPLVRITPWEILFTGYGPPTEPFPNAVDVTVLGTSQVQLTMSGRSLVGYDYNGTLLEDVTSFFIDNGVVMAFIEGSGTPLNVEECYQNAAHSGQTNMVSIRLGDWTEPYEPPPELALAARKAIVGAGAKAAPQATATKPVATATVDTTKTHGK